MNSKRAFELIDESDLDSCRTMLAISAPDLYEQLDTIIRSGADPSVILSAARDFVRQAYLRERN